MIETPSIAAVLANLVASAEPAVVFTSLARQSVPAFSDTCTIDIAEDHRGRYRIAYPSTVAGGPVDAVERARVAPRSYVYQLRTRVPNVAGRGGLAFSGLIIHTWNDRAPTSADAAMAGFGVDLAVCVIAAEREAGGAAHTHGAVRRLHSVLAADHLLGAAGETAS